MEPFRIAVPDEVLDELEWRLRATRFPQPTPAEPWEAGTDAAYLHRLVEYWVDGYDWRAEQSRLNAYPQHTAKIDGHVVHFVHVRAQREEAGSKPTPLILSHGWPYSFVEMLPIVSYLTDPMAHGGSKDDAFDVVIPSLPGYCFSEAPNGRRFTGRTVAELWNKLMTEVLGHDRYGTYGEDVGASVSDWTAALFPDRVIGIHATHAAFPPAGRSGDLTAEETAFAEWLRAKWQGEDGYSKLQSTKPDTLAAALNDSPAGLASWMVEKFRTWSGGDAEFHRAWSDDDVLTTVTLYWVSGTIGSSFRPYFDGRHEDEIPPIEVPAGVSVQWGERGFPRSYAERTYQDLRFWNDLPRGGHFTVKQTPDLVAADMREFFRLLR